MSMQQVVALKLIFWLVERGVKSFTVGYFDECETFGK